jgi:hypothetical protein
VSELVTTIRAGEVSVGDRVRTANALELTVTRVDEGFMGRPNLLALVEDSDAQWLKIAAPRDFELELIFRASERAD